MCSSILDEQTNYWDIKLLKRNTEVVQDSPALDQVTFATTAQSLVNWELFGQMNKEKNKQIKRQADSK